jgi:phosphoglycolate phosphatase
MAPAMVLFDIDGTLIRRAGPHHRMALAESIRRVCQIETSTDGIPTQGMLDPDILAVMLARAGAAPEFIRKHMACLVEQAQQIYIESAPDLRRTICPGVRDVMRGLMQARIPLGLVTGNLSRIGWRKMERTGLRRYFRFGAFGEEGSTRADLVALALRRARRAGWIGRATSISLIGDHPNDVRAAKLNGIRSIAVASGLSSRRELAAHHPDVLLRDLRWLNLKSLL